MPVEFTNSIGLKFRLIPPGEFLMTGKNRVTLSQPFFVGVHQVTQRQYTKVMGRNPSSFAATGPGKDKVRGINTENFPVDSASLFDAFDFCNRLSKRENLGPSYQREGNKTTILPRGNGYRIPSEAEWEFTCWAGTQTAWSFGDDVRQLSRYAWHGYQNENARGRTHEVGKLLPNSFGMYDMHGNVSEWSWGSASGTSGMLKGGSWANARPADTRTAFRFRFDASTRQSNVGFRVVVGIDAVAKKQP